jgi:hypothetical protein
MSDYSILVRNTAFTWGIALPEGKHCAAIRRDGSIYASRQALIGFYDSTDAALAAINADVAERCGAARLA